MPRLIIFGVVMSSPIDITNVLWSFVNTVHTLRSAGKANLLQRLARLPKQPFKVNEIVLYGVSHYDFEITIDVKWDEYGCLIFPCFSSLMKGLAIIYSYQEDSWHKKTYLECMELIEESTSIMKPPHDTDESKHIIEMFEQMMQI
jgi:hypothetical protein